MTGGGDQREYPPRRAVVAWVLFDPAAQPFFSLITTFVFAPYFAARVAANPVDGQAMWGYAAGTAGLIIAILSPVLGSIADATGPRKPWVAAFSVLLVVGSAALWFAEPGAEGAVPIALVFFAIGTIGAEFATVFTNAMMPELVDSSRLGRLSGIAWAAGYVGGLISLTVMLGFLAGSPDTGLTLFGLVPAFGLDPTTFAGDRAAGPYTAIWYTVLVLPLFLFTPDVPRRVHVESAVRIGLLDLGHTLTSLRDHANALRYLIANMVYSDGLIALTTFGGIYAAGTFGWSAVELGLFGILLTITGTIGAVAGGWLDDRVGSKWVIQGALVIFAVACLGILSIDVDHVGFVFEVAPPNAGDGLFRSVGERLYLILGGLVGLAAGPVGSASRTMMVKVSPRERMTQFFGLYALTGKATSFVGPLTVGLLTGLSGSQRIGISILVPFFIVGAFLMRGVRTGD